MIAGGPCSVTALRQTGGKVTVYTKYQELKQATSKRQTRVTGRSLVAAEAFGECLTNEFISLLAIRVQAELGCPPPGELSRGPPPLEVPPPEVLVAFRVPIFDPSQGNVTPRWGSWFFIRSTNTTQRRDARERGHTWPDSAIRSRVY